MTARRLKTCITAVLVLAALSLPIASASAAGPPALAASLQHDPVQSIGVPRSSFSALSRHEVRALRSEIRRLDPGRIWILVVSPRSQEALGSVADPVFGDLPAGVLLAVAEDPRDANTTHYWVGSSWEHSTAAQARLNHVIQTFHKGQGTLFDDLRLAIRSFARADAAAGHPPLSSGSEPPAPSVAIPGGAGNAGLITLAVLGAIVLVALGIVAVGRVRRASRASHRRREELADRRAQAQADFDKLGEQIEALDIDSQMPGTSAPAKDEYAKALDCYEEARRRMDQLDDDYQLDRATVAIARGLDHVDHANRLFNPAPHAQTQH